MTFVDTADIQADANRLIKLGIAGEAAAKTLAALIPALVEVDKGLDNLETTVPIYRIRAQVDELIDMIDSAIAEYRTAGL